MANNIVVAIKADVADLTAKSAVMRAEMAANQRALNDLAKQAVASGGMTDELKANLLEAGEAAAVSKAKYAEATGQLKALKGANDDLAPAQVKSSGAGRALTLQLSQVAQQGQVTGQWLKAFATQLPDIAVGMSMAGSNAGKFATILGSTWGIAATSAIGLALTLAPALFGVGDAADDASKKNMTLKGALDRVSDATKEVMKALRDYNDERERDRENSDSMIKLNLAEAQAKLKNAIATRELLQAKIAEQEDTARRFQIANPETVGADIGVSMAETSLAENEAKIRTLKETIGNLRIEDAMRDAKAAVDPITAINNRYDDMAEAAKRAAASNGELTVSLKATLTEIEKQRKAALDEERGKTREFGREIGADEAKSIAKGAGFKVTSAQRSRSEQERLYNTVRTPENPVAKPGTSAHETGNALDIAFGDGVTPASIKKAFEDEGVKLTKILKETGHYHIEWKKPSTSGQPSMVQQWTEELHNQQIASNDFLKDQTSGELKFWQDKLAATKQGSREYLEIQDKIYSAQKRLAQQDYQSRIADLNQKLEADRGNWTAEKANWDEKLAYIREKNGEESTEYKNAYRDFTREKLRHEDEMARVQEDGARREVTALKSRLDSARQAREIDARTSQTATGISSGASPIGDIRAAVNAGAIRQQLDDQELADLQAKQQAEDALNAQVVSRALERYGEDSQNYQSALANKLEADQQYAQQREQLEARMRANQMQSIQSVQSAYHSYIDGMVGATSSGLVRSLAGTQTWGQAVQSVYGSALSIIEQKLTQVVSNWIVQHLFMSATQKAQLAVQTGAHAASEGAKTAATVAGQGARAAARIGGTALETAQLAIGTGSHVAAEAVKTGATAVGQSARVAATAAGASASAAITSTHNMKEVISHAATAAAGAYHAMAAIPVVGPILGAAAAATTFAAVTAFGALASFDKGANVIPNDMVAQIHAGERIIPAADNRQMISIMQKGAETGGQGGATGAAGHSITYAPTINGNMPFSSQLRRHERDVVDLIHKALRTGKLKVT